MTTELPLILVVEDNPKNRRLVEMVLQGRYRLSFAEDGEEALRKIAVEDPALVLLDIQIPKIDGLEVARRVRADPERGSLPIVALTSYAMDLDREKILAAGCDDCITKPFDTRRLVDQIAGHLARRRKDASE